ncbi:4-hydroxyphenylacetate decarboxylase small subunit [Solidesulfovibrio sp.]|uniref:4-hydroxyphenylacetate decarboxylase small subunit n=1 Tax=Solidesulfovibrio sp. TaxID=2910990 RepID=UPI00260F9379|nr:4-hydroxyphenylacetate decarboxylase small subunit [Solidesulfovibrio sp.]
MTLAYRDTREFVPVDADKGLDRLTGKMVQADANAPAGYTKLPKCKFCKNYQEEATNMGVCAVSTMEPKFMAYGDMIAVTCEVYAD